MTSDMSKTFCKLNVMNKRNCGSELKSYQYIEIVKYQLVKITFNVKAVLQTKPRHTKFLAWDEFV